MFQADIEFPSYAADAEPARFSSLVFWLMNASSNPLLAIDKGGKQMKLPPCLGSLTARAWKCLLCVLCAKGSRFALLIEDDEAAIATAPKHKELTVQDDKPGKKKNKMQSAATTEAATHHTVPARALTAEEFVAIVRVCHLCGDVALQTRLMNSVWVDEQYAVRVFLMALKFDHIWRATDSASRSAFESKQVEQKVAQPFSFGGVSDTTTTTTAAAAFSFSHAGADAFGDNTSAHTPRVRLHGASPASRGLGGRGGPVVRKSCAACPLQWGYFVDLSHVRKRAILTLQNMVAVPEAVQSNPKALRALAQASRRRGATTAIVGNEDNVLNLLKRDPGHTLLSSGKGALRTANTCLLASNNVVHHTPYFSCLRCRC